MAGYQKYLEIKSSKGYTDKFNGDRNLRLYTFSITEELLGKKTLNAELSIPIYYVDDEESLYPFDKSFYVEYNNDRYYLNTTKPVARKSNDNTDIVYTLVMESASTKQLDSVYIKNVGYCYKDSDDDGWADTNEVIEEIQVFGPPAFYGNIYGYVDYLRKNLEYIFGYFEDNNGNVVTLKGKDNRGFDVSQIPIPKYIIHFADISPKGEYGINPSEVYINPVIINYAFWRFLDEETFDREKREEPKYEASKLHNIELSNTTLLGALKKLNETFTYQEKEEDKVNFLEEVGYKFTFETTTIKSSITSDNVERVVNVITINPASEVIGGNSAEDAKVFEYGGTASEDNEGNWILDITRNTNADNFPNRIYGKGSGDNLPPNYLRIAENTIDEEHKMKTILMPYASREELIEANKLPNGNVVGDPTKTYLVARTDFPDVFDKFIYVADSRLTFADVTYERGKITKLSNASNIVEQEVGTINNLPILPSLNAQSYKTLSNKLFIFKTRVDDVVKYYAYYYSPYYSNGNLNGKWVGLGKTTSSGIELWSQTEGKELLTNHIPNNFIETGTYVIPDGHPYLVIVNLSDKGFDSFDKFLDTFKEDNPTVNIDGKLFYILRNNDYSNNGDNIYTGRFIKTNVDNGFYFTELTTYERLNPYPKYLSVFSELMPSVTRAYFAGWSAPYIYLSFYGDMVQPERYLEIQRFFKYIDKDPSFYPQDVFEEEIDIFRKIYLVLKNEDSERQRIFLGLYDTTRVDDDYKYINKAFEQGFDDFLKYKKREIVKPENVYQINEQIPLADLGKTWRPTIYIDSDNEEEVIESSQSYDIKPSFVDCWIDGIGRLDEIVDVYIPNANDKYSIGMYWADEDNIEEVTTGVMRNKKVPMLPIPITDRSKSSTIGDIVMVDSSLPISTKIINVSDLNPTLFFGNLSASLLTRFDLQLQPINYKSYFEYIEVYFIITLIDNQNNKIDKKHKSLRFENVQNSIYLAGNGESIRLNCDTRYLNKRKKKLLEGLGIAHTVLEVGDLCCLIYYDETYHKLLWGCYNTMYTPPIQLDIGELHFYPEFLALYSKWKENYKDKIYTIYHTNTSGYASILSFDTEFFIKPNTYIKELQISGVAKYKILDYDVYELKNIGTPITIGTDIDLKYSNPFDYTTREFYIWVKDIHFNPMLPAFQGDNAPNVVFSTGQVAGLDCKFAISTAHCDGVIEDTRKSVNTQIYEHSNEKDNVNSKYLIALQMIEHNSEEEDRGLFKYLPAGSVAPKPKDLFIFENVVYPHNPYVYKAEMDLTKKMMIDLREEKKYTYAIILDYIAIQRMGIDFNQIKIGNKIRIRNKSLLNSEYVEFTIKSVTITRDADSIYDKYQIVLDEDMRFVDAIYKKASDKDKYLANNVDDLINTNKNKSIKVNKNISL